VITSNILKKAQTAADVAAITAVKCSFAAADEALNTVKDSAGAIKKASTELVNTQQSGDSNDLEFKTAVANA